MQGNLNATSNIINEELNDNNEEISEKDESLVKKQCPKKRIRIRKKKDRKPWRAQTAYEVFCEQ